MKFWSWLTAAATLCLLPFSPAATVSDTQSFLRDHRHAWLPYPFPAETTTNELARLLTYDFDTIGLCFAGSYHAGQIDFSMLDAAVKMVAEKGKRAVLNLTPRFEESDGVFDQLSDGTFVTNVPYKNPNASMIDIFDPCQREKFCHWIELCARRYGKDKRVAAFVIGWGYMGETGFYIGDYLEDFNRLGSVASGYSEFARMEFNRWRAVKNIPALTQLPMPSTNGPVRDYILFHRFRTEFAGGVFQKDAVERAQALTKKPVGIFGYISVNTANYARDWAATPKADFYRSAVSAASFDLGRTLLDSGMGWEDHELNDGPWNFTLACLERDIARQIAHGGVFHAMPVRVYQTEPHWETNFFPRLASFLIHQKLAAQVRPLAADIALFQPAWAAAALPVRDASHPFVPRLDAQERCSKMAGLVESFGLRYRVVTEQDLLSPARLRSYRHIIIPLWNLMPEILDPEALTTLSRDPRVIRISSGTTSLTRSEFRALLNQHKVPLRLDFAAEKIWAGRVNNLIFNWNDQPIAIRLPEAKSPFLLGPMEYRFLP